MQEKHDDRKPFLLKPSGKDNLWGGQRLNDDFEKNINMSPLAETWECSTHPDGPSYIDSGEYKGKALAEVLKEHPEYIGSHPETAEELPVLVKLIDADKDLSIQVHPNDRYAIEHENGQRGKIEMWYVLDAVPGAQIIYGFNQDVSKQDLRKGLTDGSINRYLNKVTVHKNEVFLIEPGTVHAIGAGILVAEIQESSNLTYRLYDYDREDKNGKKRELHIEKAFDVIDLSNAQSYRQPIRKLEYKPGCAKELLARCKYFETYRMIINTERKQNVSFRADELSFRILLCVSGCGTMKFCDDYLDVYKGDCFFIPADSTEIRLHGKLEMIEINS